MSSDLKQSRRASYTAAELLKAQQKQYAPPPGSRNATIISKTDLLLSLPPPVLHLAAKSRIFISFCLFLTRLFYWNHPNPYAPWLLLGSWLLISQAGDVILWTLPIIIILAAIVIRLKQTSRRSNKNITTNNNKSNDNNSSTPSIKKEKPSPTSTDITFTPAELSQYIADASDLASLITRFNQESRLLIDSLTWKDQTSTFTLIKFLITSYPFYLLLIYLLSLRTAICLTGCIIITWNARWARIARQLIYKSALVRIIARICIKTVCGFHGVHAESRRGMPVFTAVIRVLKQGILLENRPPPPPHNLEERSNIETQSVTAEKKGDSSSGSGSTEKNITEKAIAPSSNIVTPSNAIKFKENRGQDVYFLFTIFENQRWWVALDWTSALLPNERPSWSDTLNGPVSPPDSFELPEKSITYTRSPTRKDPDAHVKRTYEWRWFDPEWRVRPAFNKSREATPRPRSITQSSVVLAGPRGTPPTTPTKRRSHIRSLSLFSMPRFDDNAKQPQSEMSADMDAKGGNEDENAVIEETEEEPLKSKEGDNDSEEKENDGEAQREGDEEEEWDADVNGWQYGDNTWEKMSGKVGMGRYTRRRAWIRRAYVVEILEHVSGDEARKVEQDQEEGLRRRKVIEKSNDDPK